jgi:hypothetical protein
VNEDHFSINVARRVKPDTAEFGPYHQHVMRITVPATKTKKEAIEVYDGVCERYPEPEFKVTLTQNVYRGRTVACSSGGK